MHKVDAIMVWGLTMRPCAMVGDEKRFGRLQTSLPTQCSADEIQ